MAGAAYAVTMKGGDAECGILLEKTTHPSQIQSPPPPKFPHTKVLTNPNRLLRATFHASRTLKLPSLNRAAFTFSIACSPRHSHLGLCALSSPSLSRSAPPPAPPDLVLLLLLLLLLTFLTLAPTATSSYTHHSRRQR